MILTKQRFAGRRRADPRCGALETVAFLRATAYLVWLNGWQPSMDSEVTGIQ